MIALGVAIAGALGALARWGLTALVDRSLPPGFPHGTLVVNVVGSFILGWSATLLLERWPVSMPLRALWLTGFLGAFTTFSTFAFDTILLWRGGESVRAVLNVLLSLGLGLGAAVSGVLLGLHSRP